MNLISAIKSIITNSFSYYIRRQSWKSDEVVYMHKPKVAVLLNDYEKSMMHIENQILIKQFLLSKNEPNYTQYCATCEDLLADDWEVIEKTSLITTLEHL